MPKNIALQVAFDNNSKSDVKCLGLLNKTNYSGLEFRTIFKIFFKGIKLFLSNLILYIYSKLVYYHLQMILCFPWFKMTMESWKAKN